MYARTYTLHVNVIERFYGSECERKRIYNIDIYEMTCRMNRMHKQNHMNMERGEWMNERM